MWFPKYCSPVGRSTVISRTHRHIPSSSYTVQYVGLYIGLQSDRRCLKAIVNVRPSAPLVRNPELWYHRVLLFLFFSSFLLFYWKLLPFCRSEPTRVIKSFVAPFFSSLSLSLSLSLSSLSLSLFWLLQDNRLSSPTRLFFFCRCCCCCTFVFVQLLYFRCCSVERRRRRCLSTR